MDSETRDSVALAVELESPMDRRRGSALMTVLAGAAVSLGLMFWTGHRNSSLLLILLFTFWVASPFAAMVFVLRRSRRWPPARQTVICKQIPIISLGSALVYAALNLRHISKPAGPFLAVPVASWLVLALCIRISASSTSKQASRPQS
jgi:peptidoglycan/LPS O-acetylase OafA/YrhL